MDLTMLDQFTYEEYGELLQLIRTGRANLRFADCEWAEVPPRYFLLRHDIDFSPEAGLEMARFETARGIRATFFLLLSSPFYNLMSEAYCTVPRQLAALGHEVGLHYDVKAMAERARGDLLEELETEVHQLGRLAGEPIRSVAMHNPSVHGEDPFLLGTRFINAYDQRFTKDIAYFSDSCGAWRNTTFEILTSGQLPDRLQLLVHPLFWGGQSGNRWERLQTFVNGSQTKLLKQQEEIRELWLTHPGVREHDSRT